MRPRAGSRDPALRAALLLVVLGAATLGALTGCDAGRSGTRPLPEGTRISVRGHREVALRGGEALPRFLGGRNAGLCLELAGEVDASQWRAALTLRGGGLPARPLASLEPSAPVGRSGPVLCFELGWPAELDSPADLELCGRVTDLYDRASFEVPCQTIRFEPDSDRRAALMREVGEAVSDRHEGPLAHLVDRLAELAKAGRAAGFPALGVRTDLIAVHYILQEGASSEVAQAERLLGSLPEWIRGPAATGLAADAVFLSGVLRFQRREELEGAWQDFLEAGDLYTRILDRKRLAAVRGQVEVLAQVGAIHEGLLRLRQALADCARAPCSPAEQAGALGLESWLTLLDTDASMSELAAASADLETLLEEPQLEPAERANHLINLALLQARQGRPPAGILAQTDGLFQGADGSRRADVLAHWGRMAEALYELSRPAGDLDRAQRWCSRLAHEEPTPQLTAWAYSCQGRILRLQGRLDAAQAAFRKALTFHGQATPKRLGRLLPLGPSHRADDHYRAARLALDLGDADLAWRLLVGLDRELAGASEQIPAADIGYRAFALEDEILLLQRSADGRVREVRRTALARGDLRERTDAIARALEERRLSDREWRDLVRPLAEALQPENLEDAGSGTPTVVTYALHGLLQGVPLAALPIPSPPPVSGGRSDSRSDDPGARRWLSETAVLAVRPAISDAPPAAPAPAAAPLMVLDPAENLGSRKDLATFYGERFPGSRLLVGRDATVPAFRADLPAASWLHADTHGFYDPAFPERSSLELADGVITLRELAELPLALSFANLSGCRTGTWPVTADSGRYGIGGLLARRGAEWVIASRADLLNRLALEFNPVFYRALSSGASVPQAYDRALAAVRRELPAVAWASIFLLHGGGASPGSVNSLSHDDETPAPSGEDDSQLRTSSGGGR